MNTGDVLGRSEFAAMVSGGKPFRAYIKTILGKVLVKYWDNFTNQPAEALLSGDPKKKEETCIIKVWSEREDAYFRATNRYHFQKGIVVPYEIPEKVEEVERPIEQATDEELLKIIKMKYMALINKLNEIESEAVLFRMVNLARDAEVSEKIIKPIEARLTEVQEGVLAPSDEE